MSYQRVTSADVNRVDNGLLSDGYATIADEAEEMFLDESLERIAVLAADLSDADLAEHEATHLLVSHGSRTGEDGVL